LNQGNRGFKESRLESRSYKPRLQKQKPLLHSVDMSKAPSISFEFFPPRTEKQQETFLRAREAFRRYVPEYYSVTFGAGGSTRDRTLETIIGIKDQTDVAPAPHISCIGTEAESVRSLLEAYQRAGIGRLVVLRGDMPSGMAATGEFSHANELLEFIRAETGDHFHIEVACYPEFHPQSENARRDLENFKRKIDAGANGAITQYFYNPDAYFRFVDAARGIGVDVPITAGIMPITNFTQLARFSDGCGAEIPQWLRARLADYQNDLDSLRAFGLDVVTELCRRVIEGGAPGIHFYTLNRARATSAICDNLGLGANQDLA